MLTTENLYICHFGLRNQELNPLSWTHVNNITVPWPSMFTSDNHYA